MHGVVAGDAHGAQGVGGAAVGSRCGILFCHVGFFNVGAAAGKAEGCLQDSATHGMLYRHGSCKSHAPSCWGQASSPVFAIIGESATPCRCIQTARFEMPVYSMTGYATAQSQPPVPTPPPRWHARAGHGNPLGQQPLPRPGLPPVGRAAPGRPRCASSSALASSAARSSCAPGSRAAANRACASPAWPSCRSSSMCGTRC